MAEGGEIGVETTQPRNSAPLLEHATEENCADGVGGSTTNHIATPSNSHKRPGGSSPGKVRMDLTLIFLYNCKVLRSLVWIYVWTLTCVFMYEMGW